MQLEPSPMMRFQILMSLVSSAIQVQAGYSPRLGPGHTAQHSTRFLQNPTSAGSDQAPKRSYLVLGAIKKDAPLILGTRATDNKQHPESMIVQENHNRYRKLPRFTTKLRSVQLSYQT